MLVKICLALCLLACVPAWCQTQANDLVDNGADNAATDATTHTAKNAADGGAENAATAEADKKSQDDTQLPVPPPVSITPYATTQEGENEGNFLKGGITFTTAYSNNVAWAGAPVSDVSFSFWPTIALDRTTERMHLVLDYAPGFTLYQHTTSFNQANQALEATFSYRLTPNLTATVTEGFQQTSNLFNQPNPVGATNVFGGLPVSNVAVIAPLAETISNSSAAQLNYQVSANGMLGASGTYGALNYPNPDQVAGLYNSRAAGGSFFYATRIHERNFIGAEYQYQNYLSFQTNSPSTTSQIQTVFVFYTMYLKPSWSISVAAGPQHYSSTQASLPAAAAWQPMTMVSTGWQGERNAVAASYSRSVSGGGGLSGTFSSNNIALSFSRQFNRVWSASASGSYSNYENLTPFFLYSTPGGHSVSGAVSLTRTFSEHASVQFGYNWVQQDYSDPFNGINAPNVSRVFVTLNFSFARPLHR